MNQLIPGKLYAQKNKPEYLWCVNDKDVICVSKTIIPPNSLKPQDILLYLSYETKECFGSCSSTDFGNQKIASFLHGTKTLLCYNDNIERFICDWKSI